MAPERPRRKPQVFPKSHFPQRRNLSFVSGYFALRGEFLSERSERNQRIAGASFVRKALRLRLALSLTIPPDPRFTGEPEGGAGNSGRRGSLVKGV